VTLIDFNPWMFSGAQQLVEPFFRELAAQLKLKPDLNVIGKDLEEYGEMFAGLGWVPLIGPWIERGHVLNKAISGILKRQGKGVAAKRAELNKRLAEASKPVLVVLDDIDRLSTSEIRDVFKLVRLTASFPKVIYLVAFDRQRVESALAEDGITGRDYLEKILQLAVDLPAIPPEILERQIFSVLDSALASVENPGPFDHDAWPDIFTEIVRPLIGNMRDVRRYSVAVHGTLKGLGGQIAVTDVYALEAVRLFLPDVFSRLHTAADALTDSSRTINDPEPKTRITELVDSAGPRSKLVRDLIERLFPAAKRHLEGSAFGREWKGQWLKDRRVANEDILRLYLERVVGQSLGELAHAEKVWGILADHDALDAYLRSIPKESLQDVIAKLEVYQQDFDAHHAIPATIVLLNLMPDIPERQLGMFELPTSWVVRRVIYRLLKPLNGPEAVEQAVRQILPRVKSLSSKFELLTLVGHKKDIGRGLISEAVATQLERIWRNEVRAASVDDLIKEKELLRILIFTKRDGLESEPALIIPNSPQLTLAIIANSQSEVRTQSSGSRAVSRSSKLAWGLLVELFDGEPALKDRIQTLKAMQKSNETAPLLALVEKYASGHSRDD
jgi:hypothetical protein